MHKASIPRTAINLKKIKRTKLLEPVHRDRITLGDFQSAWLAQTEILKAEKVIGPGVLKGLEAVLGDCPTHRGTDSLVVSEVFSGAPFLKQYHFGSGSSPCHPLGSVVGCGCPLFSHCPGSPGHPGRTSHR